MFALTLSKRMLVAAVVTALGAIPYMANAQDSDDPPPEAGRISYISGNVSIQPATADQWGQAYPNLPVGPGDRIFTDNDGRAEIQIGRTYVRVGPNSDVTLVDDNQFNINFGVAQGSIRLHSFGLWPRQLVDVSTPNGNAEFGEQGDLRVDVMPTDGATVFTNLGQFADITGAGDYRQQLDYGQSLEVAGTNPVYPQWLQPAGPDQLDSWSQDRDQRLTRVASYNYVSPDVPGAADLDSSGDWQAETEYGPMWFPRDVSADWQPYRNGHWINREPWGWVWVEDEPWGYAPFHYGRWVQYRDRWGWVPGPVNVRPVWSPALVVFAGGGGGLSLSAWFPLGPGEAYRPWYRCSDRYIDRVNITNIRPAPRVVVRNTYVNVTNVTNITYINRTHVVAVPRDDFASGRRVRDVAVRMDQRQMQQMRPMAQPAVAAPSRPIITRPVAHVPAKVERPMLINQRGQEIAAKPRAVPVAPPVRQAPPQRPLPGRTVVAAPAHQNPNGRGPQGPNQSPAARGNQDQQRNNQPNQPPIGTPRANPAAAVPGYQRGVEQRQGNQPNQNQPVVNPNERQDRQRPAQPAGRPVPPNNQQENRPNPPQMNVPDRGRPNDQRPGRPDTPQQDRPNNQPVPPNYQQQQRPNPPQMNQPDRGRPNDQRPGRPDNPQQDRPNNQPVPPTYQQQQRPNPPQMNQPDRGQQNDQRPGRPDNPQQDRPNNQPVPPNGQQPGRPNYPQPDRRSQPNDQPVPRPNQPQNPPPSNQNRQDYRPPQQDRPRDAAPQAPPQGRPEQPQRQDRQYTPPPQARPTPPPQQDRQFTPPPQRANPQHEERQAPPPQRANPQHEERQAPPPRSFDQPRPNREPPQARPQQNDRQNNKDQKKDKKEDKKPN
jgi:hypothetical protein